MSGSTYGSYHKQKDRRPYLLLLLLPLAYLLGGVSYAFVRGEPARPTPIVLAAATASPTAETSAGDSPTEQATTTPKPTEAVGGASATPARTPNPTPDPSAAVIISDVTFRISGSIQSLFPGIAQPIRIAITNPNSVAIYITSINVRLPQDSSPTGCRTAQNITIVQSDASVADPVILGAGESITFNAAPRSPQMTLLNLPGVNQDVCKGKVFHLTFTGSAHS